MAAIEIPVEALSGSSSPVAEIDKPKIDALDGHETH